MGTNSGNLTRNEVQLDQQANLSVLNKHHGRRKDDRILSAGYSDNYVSLLPNETRTFEVEALYPNPAAMPACPSAAWNARAATVDVSPARTLAT